MPDGGHDIGVGLISVGWMGKLHTRVVPGTSNGLPRVGSAASPRACRGYRTGQGRNTHVMSSAMPKRALTIGMFSLIPDVDVVSICAPTGLHREIGVAAAEAGKPFWIEKPVGRDAKEAADVAAAAHKAGVVTSVGYNYRHAPAVEHVRELVTNGELGRITNVRAVFFNGYASEPKGALSWRFIRDLAGFGALGDLLSHVVDLVQYLLGPISDVTALTSTVYTERPILPMGSGTHFAVIEDGELAPVENDDYAAALVRFAPDSRAAGAVGTLEASRVIVGPQCGIGFEIYGTEGSADLELRADERIADLPGSRWPALRLHHRARQLPPRRLCTLSAGSGHQHGPRRSQGHRGEEVPRRGDRWRAS